MNLRRAASALVIGDIPRQSRHYHVIDVVRGFAACAILFWHYQHFIALGMAPPGSRSGYPLYRFFWLFYEQGGAAVQLFWIISGFVFSAVYVGSGTTARCFFEHRAARLYPLHLITLFIVAGLQALCRAAFGRSLIYHDNSAGNFALQLLMGTGWGIGGSGSFDGPIWSVSAEVFIYALFWLSLRHLFRWRLVIPLLASGAFFVASPWSPIAACGAYFFLGCAIYAFHRTQSPLLQYAAAALGVAVFGVLLQFGRQGEAVLFLFASLVLASAALEDGAASSWARRMPWIADNTYGVYLWHIPIQLMLMLVLAKIGVSRTVAFSPWFLLLFLAVVIVLARASSLLIERPARNAIGGRIDRRPLPFALRPCSDA